MPKKHKTDQPEDLYNKFNWLTDYLIIMNVHEAQHFKDIITNCVFAYIHADGGISPQVREEMSMLHRLWMMFDDVAGEHPFE